MSQAAPGDGPVNTCQPHPAVAGVLKFFTYAHLPVHLRAVSAPCAELATNMADFLPPSPEVTAGLRKLLEAKDCFVRAAVEMHAKEE